jgi:YD repeat-containing protein
MGSVWIVPVTLSLKANISSMGVDIEKFGQPYLYNYQYDQLNRLVSMDAWKSNNTWSTMNKVSDYQERLAYDENGNITSYQRNGIGSTLNLNNYTYNYQSGTNRITSISNSVNSSTGTYNYDSIGNVTKDDKQNVAANTWNVYGKLQSVQKTDGTIINYTYDAAGNRISKIIGDTLMEYYVRDAAGNLMATYTKDTLINNGHLSTEEFYKYGSGLLGVWKKNIDMVTTVPTDTGMITFNRGESEYYLRDHRDNTMATVSDKKQQVSSNGTTVSYYEPDVKSAAYYSSYGVITQNYNVDSIKFAFNGQRRSPEISITAQTALYWEYNGDVGKRWNVDPLTAKLPGWSPYPVMADNPILMFDVDGQFPYPIHIRSFAPYKTFGFGFSGDNRGYSTVLGVQEGGSVTSRIQQTFVVDPTAATHTNARTWSDPSYHPLFGTKTAKPAGDITDFKSSKDKQGNSTVSFTSNYAGNLPLIPSADIDVHTKFTLVENTKAGTLNVIVTQTGDQYPSAETLIGDTKGNQLLIGVSPAVGFDDIQSLGPFEKLPGDNKLPMMTNSFTVLLDKKGVFTGVKQGDKTYSVADWNKMMGSKPLEKQEEKPLPTH